MRREGKGDEIWRGGQEHRPAQLDEKLPEVGLEEGLEIEGMCGRVRATCNATSASKTLHLRLRKRTHDSSFHRPHH